MANGANVGTGTTWHRHVGVTARDINSDMVLLSVLARDVLRA